MSKAGNYLYNMLPVEMIDHIILHVNSTDSILNLRQVDRFFYYKLKTKIPYYQDGIKQGYFIIEDNTIKKINLKKQVQREIIFKKWGNFIFKEYKNGNIKKIIKSDKPLKTSMITYEPSFIESITYDLYKSKETRNVLPLNPACVIC